MFESPSEGRCAKIVRVGPFGTKGPVIARLHAETLSAGYLLSGKHPEVYLSNICRAKPENWRIILR